MFCQGAYNDDEVVAGPFDHALLKDLDFGTLNNNCPEFQSLETQNSASMFYLSIVFLSFPY